MWGRGKWSRWGDVLTAEKVGSNSPYLLQVRENLDTGARQFKQTKIGGDMFRPPSLANVQAALRGEKVEVSA